jgi:hypothetical protein
MSAELATNHSCSSSGGGSSSSINIYSYLFYHCKLVMHLRDGELLRFSYGNILCV